MDPLKVAAQHAAFVWFTSSPEHLGKGHDEAVRFAREHWVGFLPVAHEGWGRLLMRLARPRRQARRLPLRRLARGTSERRTATLRERRA